MVSCVVSLKKEAWPLCISLRKGGVASLCVSLRTEGVVFQCVSLRKGGMTHLTLLADMFSCLLLSSCAEFDVLKEFIELLCCREKLKYMTSHQNSCTSYSSASDGHFILCCGLLC